MAGHRMSLHVTHGWSRCPARESVVVRTRPDRCILIMAMPTSVALPSRVEESAFRSMKSAITSCAASTMCPPLAVLQPRIPQPGGMGSRRAPQSPRRRTYVDEVSSAASTGRGSPSSKPRGVAVRTRSQPVGSGDPARTRTWSRPESRSKLDEVLQPVLTTDRVEGLWELGRRLLPGCP